MGEREILLVIAGMSAVTAALRIFPGLVAERALRAPGLQAWLRYLPACVLAALVAPELALRHETLDFSVRNIAFWAALPTLSAAYETRSIAATVVTGCLTYGMLRFLIGAV